MQDVEALLKKFWRETPEARREALMPFLWGVVAKQGELYGNRDKGSVACVTNGLNFSCPGYNEMLTGRPNLRIDKNVFNDIFNVQRSSLFVRAGWEVPGPEPLSPRAALLKKRYATTTRAEADDVPDSFTRRI